MPRAARHQSQTAIYHALIRGINQQTIFEDSEDCRQFLTFLAEVKAISQFEFYAYCLMGNHVHLLLKETEEPIAQIFRRLGARYVQWFNGKYQRSGHLFQDRYKSEPVVDDAYFVTVIRYIHNNPVKAGLCKNPKTYEWSSLKLLEQKSPPIDWWALEQIMPLVDIVPVNDASDTKNSPLEVSINRKASYSDEGARDLLDKLCGIKNVADFQAIAKDVQRPILSELRSAGLSIRQIARITGTAKGIVERWSKE